MKKKRIFIGFAGLPIATRLVLVGRTIRNFRVSRVVHDNIFITVTSLPARLCKFCNTPEYAAKIV